MDKGYLSSTTQTRASLTSAINSSILSRRIQRGHLDIPKLACHSAIHCYGTRVQPHVSEPPLVPSLQKEEIDNNSAHEDGCEAMIKALQNTARSADSQSRDRSVNGMEFLLAKAEKERRELRSRVEEHLLLHLDYSPQKARMETAVI